MKIVVYTLGCKVNQYESESMMSMLERMGHTVFSHLEVADVYIINTCAVTNEAEKKSRQTIAKCKALNPNARIMICGCASEKNANQFENKNKILSKYQNIILNDLNIVLMDTIVCEKLDRKEILDEIGTIGLIGGEIFDD